jgi:hypothetical protein
MAKPNNQGTIGREIGRKLSVAEMGWDKPSIQALVIAQQNANHFLARFVGVVTGLKPYKIKEGDRAGDTAYGLQGQFQATGADGSVRDGSVLYLPGYVNDAIVSIFAADDSVSSVRVAFDVYAHYDVDAATSYVFTVNDLLNTGSQSVDEVKAEIQALPLPSAPVPLQIENKSE